MADTISYTVTLRTRNPADGSGFVDNFSKECAASQTLAGGGRGSPFIGVAEELLDWGAITNPGILGLFNNGLYPIQVGIMADYVFVPVLTLRPTQFHLFEPYDYLYVKSIGGISQLHWYIQEGIAEDESS